MEVTRNVALPESRYREAHTSAGITLEVTPVIKGDIITVAGKSIVRRTLTRIATPTLQAVSFSTLESYFRCDVQCGDKLVIMVGDGPRDKARIILDVTLIDAEGRQVHANERVPLAAATRPKKHLIASDGPRQ